MEFSTRKFFTIKDQFLYLTLIFDHDSTFTSCLSIFDNPNTKVENLISSLGYHWRSLKLSYPSTSLVHNIFDIQSTSNATLNPIFLPSISEHSIHLTIDSPMFCFDTIMKHVANVKCCNTKCTSTLTIDLFEFAILTMETNSSSIVYSNLQFFNKQPKPITQLIFLIKSQELNQKILFSAVRKSCSSFVLHHNPASSSNWSYWEFTER